MPDPQTELEIAPEGKVIDPEWKTTTQVPAHIHKYQHEWIKKVRDEEGFNFSRKVRKLLDYIIEHHDSKVPEEVFVEREEDQGNLQVFVRDEL